MAVMDAKPRARSTEETKKDTNDTQVVKKEKDEMELLKDEIEDLKSDLTKLKKCVTCVICQDLLFEPYSLQCGHVFCYTCLLDWFHHKKTCPECRAVVDRQPASAYLVRDMIDTFVIRAELSSPHDQGAELRKLQAEALAAVERDKNATGRRSGLFQGLFTAKPMAFKYGVRDGDDDILRCPDCIWEVSNGICENCGQQVRDQDADDYLSDMDYDDDDDDDDDGFDDDSDDSSSDDGHNRREIVDFPFGPYVDELDRRRINPSGINNGDAGGTEGRPAMFRDDENYEDDENIGREHIRRRQDRNMQREFAFRVQISANNGGRRPVNQLPEMSGVWRDRFRETILEATNTSDSGGHDSEDDSEDDDEDDSLGGFIVNEEESPRSGNARHTRESSNSTVDTNTSVATTTSDLSSPARNPNQGQRRVVIDEDDDDLSSLSDASPRGAQNSFTGRTYTPRRGPIALSSDEDDDDEGLDDEEDSLLGYTKLDHDSQNEDHDNLGDMQGDDPSMVEGGVSALSSSLGGRMPSRGVTFANTDNVDRGNQQDADMANGSGAVAGNGALSSLAGNRRRRDSTPTSSSMARRTRRSVESPSSVTNTDTDDDDDEPVARRARPNGRLVGGSGRNYSGSHHESSSTHLLRNNRQSGSQASNNRSDIINDGHHRARQTNNPFDRRREVIPGISQILRRHGQQRTENQFDYLARLSSSPARSVTPVPNSPNVTGNGGNSGNGGSMRAYGSTSRDREISVEPLNTTIFGGVTGSSSGGRASGGTTPVPINRPVAGAGSVSQYSSSSPFPSNTMSEIAGLVSDPQAARSGDQSRAAPESEAQSQSQSQRTRSTAAPVVTPPPPRTSVPRPERNQNTTAPNNPIAADVHQSNPPVPPSPAVVASPTQQQPQRAPRLLHHHRDHQRAPTTVPPPGMLSSQNRTIGHRGSRAGLREAGSRRNLRPSASRNAMRATTPTPTSTNGASGSQVGVASPLNPHRTGSGPTANNLGSAGPSGTSLVEEAMAGSGPRPPPPRLQRYTHEEISRMGETMIMRRMEEVRRQAALGLNAEGSGSAPTRPNASSHWRTLSAGDESAQILRRLTGRRDVSAAASGSGSGSAAATASPTSPAAAGEDTGAGGVLQRGFAESPVTSPLSSLLFLSPVTPFTPRRDQAVSGSGSASSPLVVGESPSPLSMTQRFFGYDAPTRSSSGPSAIGSGSGVTTAAAAGPSTTNTTSRPRLGVGIGTGGPGGPIFVIRGGTDPGPGSTLGDF
ncbi:hypothetical protein EV426DRAFT_709585 [Tirmania nivea]|nr:hypothetical protein EV426DRAFT_709585 [Tirmania nivea]